MRPGVPGRNPRPWGAGHLPPSPDPTPGCPGAPPAGGLTLGPGQRCSGLFPSTCYPAFQGVLPSSCPRKTPDTASNWRGKRSDVEARRGQNPRVGAGGQLEDDLIHAAAPSQRTCTQDLGYRRAQADRPGEAGAGQGHLGLADCLSSGLETGGDLPESGTQSVAEPADRKVRRGPERNWRKRKRRNRRRRGGRE